jgi:1,4-dihydroxy-2-naphthoate octaprenyltransferase
MNEKKTLSYWIGHICGTVVLACLAICIMAIVVALTYKFIFWLL